MTQEKPGEVERCEECDGRGVTTLFGPYCPTCKGTGRQPAAPAEPAWKYAGINLNPEHFETFAPEENAHEGRGLDGSASTGVDSGVGGKHRTGNVPIEELIERSSLGTPEVKAIRAKTPRSVVDAVLKRADELSENASAEGERVPRRERQPMQLPDEEILAEESELRAAWRKIASLESALAASKAREGELKRIAEEAYASRNGVAEQLNIISNQKAELRATIDDELNRRKTLGQQLSAAQAEIARLKEERNENLRMRGKYFAEAAAATAEIARLRGLLESLAGEWEFRSEDEPDHGDQHDFAGRVYSHCSQALRSALSSSAPTKEPGGGG